MPATSSLPLLLLLLAAAAAAPVRYDQRQDGDFNVHAHLENFVVVLIPTSGSSGGGGGLGILDFLKKAGAHVRTAEQPIQDHQSPNGTPQDQHNLVAEASEVAVVEVQPEAEQQPKEVVQPQPQPQAQAQRREQEEDLQPAASEAVEAVLVAESPALVVAKADAGHPAARPAHAAPQEAGPQRRGKAVPQAAARCPQGQFRDATGVCHYIGSDQRVGDQFFIGLVPPFQK